MAKLNSEKQKKNLQRKTFGRIDSSNPLIKLVNTFRSGENEGGKAKEYSWDKKRENVDTSKYIIQQLTTGSEEVRLPGSINGKLREQEESLKREEKRVL